MSQSKNETKSDKSVRKEVIGLIGVIAAALITGLCGPAVLRLFDRTPTSEATPSVTATAAPTPQESLSNEFQIIPAAYFAMFGVEFPEGAWIEGETYEYILQVQECGSDSFKGQTISFKVSDVSGEPFFLLKDGLYNFYDKNYALPVEASSFYYSYAIVLLTKNTIGEAQRVLDSCKASIIVNNGPARPLEPYYRPLASGSTFDIKAAEFMQILP